MMRGKTILVTIICIILITFAAWVWGASGERERTQTYREGEILVKFRSSATMNNRHRARGLVNTVDTRKFIHVGVEKLSLGTGITALEALDLLSSAPDVEYAELNWRVEYLDAPRIEPDDPGFISDDQWYLDAEPLPGYHATVGNVVYIDRDIDAPEAWAVMGAVFSSPMSGSVGVLDSGCGEFGFFNPSIGYLPNHQDLPNGSLWANTVELSDPGTDSPMDVNTLVDDVNGWDFMEPEPGDNIPADIYDSSAPYHGTRICGIVAAGWDNATGIAGIGVDSLKVLPLRTAYLSEIVAAIEYAINTTSGSPPVRVLNASWRFDQPIQSLQDAIEAAGLAGIALVAAAGNDGVNNDLDNGIYQAYPAQYTKVPLENVLAVAATEDTGSLTSFTNYGPASVQVAAPGQGIYSVSGGTGGYASGNGTSYAAPIAASALALVMAANPTLTTAEAIDRIIDGGDFDARLSGLIRSGKRINLAGALAPFAPYSGFAPMDSLQHMSGYGDSISSLYGSISNAISDSPSVAVMVTTSGGAWAVSPVSPGLTTFNLEFDGVSAPVGTYETGTWRVTGISPFFAQVESGQVMTFTSLIPSSAIDWAVTDTSVGTIDSDGVFTALSAGTTRVILNVDGQDVDNSGVVLVINAGEDEDGDGFSSIVDCDDTDPDINPGADEICIDGIDNDCDGDVDADDSECGKSSGGGCGTTLPPGDDPWSGPVMIATFGLILFGLRRRWLAEVRPESRVQSPES
jgi:hypothetical protein